MKKNYLIGWFSIFLAVLFFYLSMSNSIDIWICIIIFVVSIIFCLFLSFIENKLWISRNNILNKILLLFSKNRHKYKILNKKVTYEILSNTEARYQIESQIKVINENEFVYNPRYVWDQKDIDIELLEKDKFEYELDEDMKWTNVNIKPKEFVTKGTIFNKIGFKLLNLKIFNLKKHAFLSSKINEKIDNLTLIVKINNLECFKKYAIFKIEDPLIK